MSEQEPKEEPLLTLPEAKAQLKLALNAMVKARVAWVLAESDHAQALARCRAAQARADETLPRIRVYQTGTGGRSWEGVVVRRTKTSAWVRGLGEMEEPKRYVRPRGDFLTLWYASGNKTHIRPDDLPPEAS